MSAPPVPASVDPLHDCTNLVDSSKDAVPDFTLTYDANDQVKPHQLFPHTFAATNKKMIATAWYHNEPRIQSALTRYLAGELPGPGDALYRRRFQIRMIGFLGHRYEPKFSEPDDWSHIPYEDEDEEGDGYDSDYGRSYNLPVHTCAFDLIDANGREYPLLYEGRNHAHGSQSEETGLNVVIDRRTSTELVRTEGVHTGRMEVLRHASRYFSSYEPLGFTTADRIEQVFGTSSWENAYALFGRNVQPTGGHGRMAPMKDVEVAKWTKERMAAQPHLTQAEAEAKVRETYAEIGMLISIGTKPAECGATAVNPNAVWLHPPEVIKRFTVGGLRASFDSAGVRSIWSGHMPNVLIELIGSYAPVDLPDAAEVDGKGEEESEGERFMREDGEGIKCEDHPSWIYVEPGSDLE